MLTPNANKIFSNFLVTCLALAISLIAGATARAADFVFDLTPYTGDPASVQVTVHQQDANTLRFTLDQNDPSIFGDLRGMFFHVNESIIDPNDLSFSFVAAVENITNAAISPSLSSTVGLNSVDNLGGVNVNPLDNFDVGMTFGTAGIGTDDIKSFTFDVSKVGGLDQMTFMPINMDKFMAVRLTSVWDGNDREGSSKVCCGTTVPEPGVAGMMILALGGLLWRRKFTA